MLYSKISVLFHLKEQDFMFFDCTNFLLATDSTVKLWDVSRLLDEGAGLEESLLATFEYHSKSVNACRWSKDGTLLASGSDDSYVIIYCYTHNAAVSQLFGSESVKSKVSAHDCCR